MKRKEVIFDAIKSLGFDPEIDEDGDVRFESKVGTFFANCDEDGFFSLVYPAFYETDSLVKKNEALLACNEVNQKIKAAKFYIYKDDVFASVEAFQSKEENIKKVIDQSLKATYAALKLFAENIGALSNASEK